jgi:TPR repeat protein
MLRCLGGFSGSLTIALSAALIAGGTRAACGVPPAQGNFVESSPIEQLQKDAEGGNAKAQYVLGCCYNGDHGWKRDPAKAAKWWKMAAARGLADAQFCLGLSCFLGEGVPKDVAGAVAWWKKAAEQDQADAQYFLGLSYHTGLGVPTSAPLAVYWLQKSAGFGSKPAQQLLREIASSPR